MGFYLSVVANQRPFPFNIDDKRRQMWSMNFRATARAPIDEWEQDLAYEIEAAGLGSRATVGRTIYIGANVVMPDGPGPLINIIDTGGTESDFTHNGDEYEHLSVQIVVRGSVYETTRARALAIWRLFNGVYNESFGAAIVGTEGGDTLTTEGGDGLGLET